MDMMSLLFATPTGNDAFWVWLTIGLILLITEMVMGTQWMLWSAASAGIVALITLTGLPVGIISQIVLFLVVSVVSTLLSRRFLAPPSVIGDVNNPNERLIGKVAIVVSGFETSSEPISFGRVRFEDVEWPAVIKATLPSGLSSEQKVIILGSQDGKLEVGTIQ